MHQLDGVQFANTVEDDLEEPPHEPMMFINPIFFMKTQGVQQMSSGDCIEVDLS